MVTEMRKPNVHTTLPNSHVRKLTKMVNSQEQNENPQRNQTISSYESRVSSDHGCDWFAIPPISATQNLTFEQHGLCMYQAVLQLLLPSNEPVLASYIQLKICTFNVMTDFTSY
jgi:hypothetical protein